jgi:polyferredoxin
MDIRNARASARFWRRLLQAGFLILTLSVGIRFGLFVGEAAAGAPIVWQRPPAVEGFLPIGALVSLKDWLLSGRFDRIHPAALALLLTFAGISLIAKKGFCSWLCPVGCSGATSSRPAGSTSPCASSSTWGWPFSSS